MIEFARQINIIRHFSIKKKIITLINNRIYINIIIILRIVINVFINEKKMMSLTKIMFI